MVAVRVCAAVACLSLALAVRDEVKWDCPGGVAAAVCGFVGGAVTDVSTNCGLADQGILEAVGAKKQSEVYKAVAVAAVADADTPALEEAFAMGWARVHTGVAHEYLVEHLQAGGADRYRVYQANSEGPLDIRDWLGRGDIRWLEGYAEALYNWKDTGRWSFMFNQLPKENPLHAWWASVLKMAADDKKDEFVKAIVDTYAATHQAYGGGQLLGFDKLRLFLSTPVQVGGGLGPLASTGGKALEFVERWAA